MQFYQTNETIKESYGEYRLVMNPVDIDYLERNLLYIVRDYFCTGVVVNGVRYSMNGGIFPIKGGTDHVPMSYHEGACMMFLGELLEDVPQEQFSDDEQSDVVDQITKIAMQRSEVAKIVIKTSNQVKYAGHYQAFDDLFIGEICHGAFDECEIQGDVQTIALDKIKKDWSEENVLVVAEDTSFGLDCLGGAPGPYIKSFLEHCPVRSVDILVDRMGNNHCEYRSALAVKYSYLGQLYQWTSVVRCTGVWMSLGRRKDFEDSFVYGLDAKKGARTREYSLRTEKEESLIDIGVFWLRYNFSISKPTVRLKPFRNST